MKIRNIVKGNTVNKKMIALVSMTFIIGLVGFWIVLPKGSNPEQNRYDLDSKLFSDLPEMPKDFQDVWYLIYAQRIGYLENFTKGVPDENYWKQPEFYADSFERNIDAWKERRTYVAGGGPYPGDVVISNITKGDMLDAITFWHTSLVPTIKYQGIQLKADYPTEGKSWMGDIQVKQDASIAKECFDVEFNPPYFLLGTTWPKFEYNWTYKVKANINISENCPAGFYLIEVSAVDPPEEIEKKWIREYKLKYASQRAGGVWHIFLDIAS